MVTKKRYWLRVGSKIECQTIKTSCLTNKRYWLRVGNKSERQTVKTSWVTNKRYWLRVGSKSKRQTVKTSETVKQHFLNGEKSLRTRIAQLINVLKFTVRIHL